jgi:hypothetical protein
MAINKNSIICIKARSHSDFELYLVSEKYGLAYDILLDYKKDTSIYKFWVDLDLGIIIATESRSNGDKTIYVTDHISKADRSKLIDIVPVKTPKVKENSEENYEMVKDRFEQMVKEKEEYRTKMLNRKYDHNNIVCVNMKSDNAQIFALCQFYKLDFINVMSYKDEDDVTKVWFEKETGECFAFEYKSGEYYPFTINERSLIPRNIKSKISHKPVNTPKIKKTPDNIEAYIKYTDMGFHIGIPGFDKIIEKGWTKETLSDDIGLASFSIKDLEMLLEKAVEDEDYESAAEIRDAINEIKKNNPTN